MFLRVYWMRNTIVPMNKLVCCRSYSPWRKGTLSRTDRDPQNTTVIYLYQMNMKLPSVYHNIKATVKWAWPCIELSALVDRLASAVPALHPPAVLHCQLNVSFATSNKWTNFDCFDIFSYTRMPKETSCFVWSPKTNSLCHSLRFIYPTPQNRLFVKVVKSQPKHWKPTRFLRIYYFYVSNMMKRRCSTFVRD